VDWFDEQIRERIENDEDEFSRSFTNMASIIMGKSVFGDQWNDNRKRVESAIGQILKFYRVKAQDLPESLDNINEQLEFLLRPSGIMRRNVTLEGNWYKDGIGALLGSTTEGEVVAIIPRGIWGYYYLDPKSEKHIKVTSRNIKLLSEEAICFYKPLPLKSLGIMDLVKYIIQTLSPADFGMVGAASFAVTLIGLLVPKINNIIFSQVVPRRQTSLIVPIALLFVGVTISTSLIAMTKALVMSRIETKMNIAVQSASMMRVMSLPATFFKDYSSGALSSRVQNINNLCTMLADVVLSTGLTLVFSLVYITQIFNYAPELAIAALVIILVTVVFSVITVFAQMGISKIIMERGAEQSGIVYSLISGVQKIKLSGSERRAFSKWANSYKAIAELQYNPPRFLKFSPVISTGISLVGTIVLYYMAVVSEISVADYMSFNIAYGYSAGAFMAMTSVVSTIANIRPTLEMVEPILKTVPEISEDKKVITSLSGSIELNNVSFRYDEKMPLIIDDLSLKIRPGQFVAIVGTTGCGKSTLLRLLLGFERPDKGAIYYDSKDISTVDLKSLRRNIGVVMQNGKLFQGDIYSNITIVAPWLSLEEAWEAAELADIADDIRDMPMGMNTMISEGSGGVSGGQKQRLMIARAIAPKPKILMFDEATSALDNITQKTVSQSLEQLKCTRIVIAHRLSTIKQCDRILVLDKGKIIEDGNYRELMEKKEMFSDLVSRQRLDNTGYADE